MAAREPGKAGLDDAQRAELMSAMGLGSWASGAPIERMEWAMWRPQGAREVLVERRASRLGREAARSIEADARRRMGPLRKALSKARSQRSESAWVEAMVELGQAALEAECPEREAANIMLAARVDPRALPAAAARGLRRTLAMEQAFGQSPSEAASLLGGASGPRAGRLNATWKALVERALERS